MLTVMVDGRYRNVAVSQPDFGPPLNDNPLQSATYWLITIRLSKNVFITKWEMPYIALKSGQRV